MNSLLTSQENIRRLIRFLWGAVLLTLPVTSFRYFPGLGDTTFVRPLSFYPLALLLLVLLIQFLRKKIPFPWTGSMVVLGAFFLALIAASMLGVLHAPLEMRGQTYWGRNIRAWATVAIGLSFFISAAWMNRDRSDLMFSVRWLMAGFALDIIWGGVQSLAIFTPLLDKVTVTHWQLVFSMRELVKTNRISGLAYEPAWLAGQISTIYLPWIFAALMTRTHFTRFRWLEALLLGLGGLLLLLTYSRGGLVSTVGAITLTFLLTGRDEMRSALAWFTAGFRRGESAEERHWARALGLRLGIVLMVLAALAGAFFILGQKNYMARIWEAETDNLYEFFIENSVGSRAAYNSAGMGVYDEHPWFGVGLGAAGFRMYENLPNWALTTVPEIARQLDPSNRLYPNPKNMYVRILAEAGLFGFAFYLAYLLGLLGDALSFLRRPGTMRFIGIAGLCSWLAIALYNLTQDSFATPNIWVNLGILVGMTRAISENSLEERS